MAGTARAVPEEVTSPEIDSDGEQALLARHVLAYRLDGPLFFAAVTRFLAEVTATADVRVVILRLSAVGMLDASGARALGEVVEDLEERGITVLLKGASPEHLRLLDVVGTLRPLVDRGHVFATMPGAVAHALTHAAVCAPADGRSRRDAWLGLLPLPRGCSGSSCGPARRTSASSWESRQATAGSSCSAQILPASPPGFGVGREGGPFAQRPATLGHGRSRIYVGYDPLLGRMSRRGSPCG
ncbi:sodium-independent anion transporter [Blastococcus sp. SYSU DS0510]